MTDNLDKQVAEFAMTRHGLVSFDHLRMLQVTRHEIDGRVRSGRWVRLYDEVYAIAGAPMTWRSNLLAACFAGGPHAVASHRSAAELWGWPGKRSDFVEITCPRWRRGKDVGPVVHESKALDPGDCRVVDNIPVTSPELTLLMLGAVCAPITVEMALDVALRREQVSYGSLRALLKRLGRRGRNGAGVLRTIVDERAPEQAIPESPMETKMLRLLRQLGFPPAVPQFEVWHEGRFYGRLDAAWPDVRVGVEYESYEHHTGKLALVRGNARRDAFDDIDWRIVGVTAEDLKNHGMRIAPLIHHALHRRI